MVGMHAQGDVGLATITPKVTLADKNADEHPDLEIGPRSLLFHRQVSRETFGRGANVVSPSGIT